ncbi:MAG: indole-3-glycerol phosphate synthase TrpC [Synergistaceae bacterium]|nr:indole-3-glycerol phosphate synthase TrpC [Synergistaceae bacterium]
MIMQQIMRQKAVEVAEMTSPRRSLSKALKDDGLSVIAEIMRASPSSGTINGDLDVAAQLASYERGGANAVSVFTDQVFFGGGPEDLRRLRARTRLPILRKDFIVSEVQVYESLFLGADALLLIASTLDKKRLCELAALTSSLGMETMIEVHDEDELHAALEADPRILGINNRDLNDFTLDLRTTERLMDALREAEGEGRRTVVAESGIKDEEDVRYLAGTGVDAILVGETLMRAGDPAGAIRALKDGRRAA